MPWIPACAGMTALSWIPVPDYAGDKLSAGMTGFARITGFTRMAALGLPHGSDTASTIARTCSTGPLPASPTGISRCATVCGRIAWTSSGAT